MTPEQKAKELVEKFELAIKRGEKFGWNNEAQRVITKSAKQCALICVQNEKELLTKLYQQIPENIDREAWRKWRVSIENAGIENEQIQEEIKKL